MTCEVSYLLLCYRQESFVREAVRSTLAQDITGIEIIISDDCSPDRTYEIIKDECSTYSGPNRLVVRQTKSNLGISGHINELVRMAKGKLIILGAGDDLARPHKASTIYEHWVKTGDSAYGCNPDVIDDSGSYVGKLFAEVPETFAWQEMIRRNNSLLFICAFDKRIFDRFGYLPEHCIEDQTIGFRAALTGKVHVFDAPLVEYRRHAASFSSHWLFTNRAKDSIQILDRKLGAYLRYNRDWLLDLESLAKADVVENEEKTVQFLRRRIAHYEILRQLLVTDRFGHRWPLFRQGIRNAGPKEQAVLSAFLFSPRFIAYLAHQWVAFRNRKRA